MEANKADDSGGLLLIRLLLPNLPWKHPPLPTAYQDQPKSPDDGRCDDVVFLLFFGTAPTTAIPHSIAIVAALYLLLSWDAPRRQNHRVN